jgi:hypothetical protein
MFIIERDIPVTVRNVVIGGDAPICTVSPVIVDPVITSDDTAIIPENTGVDQVVYTAETSAEVAAPITFSLTAESDPALTIDGATGAVTLADNPVYSVKSQYSFGVFVTDGVGNVSETQPVTLSVNDASLSPLNITSSSNAANFTFVSEDCDLSIDSTDSCQAANVNGLTNYQSVFVSESKIVGDEKVVTISYASDDATTTGLGIKIFFDSSEMTPSGVKDIYTTDNIASPGDDALPDTDDDDGNPETDKYIIAAWASLFGSFPESNTVDLFTLCFNGTDPDACDEVVDEIAPEFTSSADADSIEESSGAGQAVYTAEATDDSDVTYSLSGADAAEFSIDPATGVVTLTADPVFAAKASYSFVVVATDDSNNVSQQTVSLVVTEAADSGSDDSEVVSVIGFSTPSNAAGFDFDAPQYSITSSQTHAAPASTGVNTQSVYISEAVVQEDSDQITLTVSYSSNDTTTTGLGLHIHFDSSALSLTNISDVLASDAFIEPSTTATADTSDLDNNPNTDSYILATWTSLFGRWPGTVPQDLMTLTFDVVE